MSTLICDFMSDRALSEVAELLVKREPHKFTALISYKTPQVGTCLDRLKFIDAHRFSNWSNFKKHSSEVEYSQILNWTDSELYEVTHLAQKCLDRTDPRNTDSRTRLRFIYALISYFELFFEENPHVDTVLYDNTPHMAWDVILFFVAKRRQLKTIFPRRTGIGGYLYLDNDFRAEFTDVQYAYTNQLVKRKNAAFKHMLLSDLQEMSFTRGQHHGNWPHVKVNFKVIKTVLGLIGLRDGASMIKCLLNSNYSSPREASEQTKQKSTFGFEDNLSYVSYAVFLFEYTRYLSAMKSCYRSLQDKGFTIRENKYVYFPLGLQPERTTDPEAGILSEQLICIQALSKIIDDDMHIIVKEHPKQFNFDLRNYNYRSSGFYKELNEIPKVVLIDSHVDHKELIQKSAFTACLNGSVGWESLLAKKPSLLFTKNWHSKCEASPYVSDIAELKSTVHRFAKLSDVDVEHHLLNFVQSISNSLVYGCLNESHVTYFAAEQGWEEMKNSFSAAILERL